MSPPLPLTQAPPLLWAAARALLRTIFTSFGAPEAIAAQHTHRQSERRLLLKWLRAGEALLRHLLLIEAAHYDKPNTRPLLWERRVRVRRLMSFEADKPETWRVSFRCSERLRSTRELRGKPARTPAIHTRLYSAWPLAERAEAMLRAFNDPAPRAKRLARRLHATPHRAATLTRYPPNLPQVVDHFDTLRDHAETARRRFESG